MIPSWGVSLWEALFVLSKKWSCPTGLLSKDFGEFYPESSDSTISVPSIWVAFEELSGIGWGQKEGVEGRPGMAFVGGMGVFGYESREIS